MKSTKVKVENYLGKTLKVGGVWFKPGTTLTSPMTIDMCLMQLGRDTHFDGRPATRKELDKALGKPKQVKRKLKKPEVKDE